MDFFKQSVYSRIDYIVHKIELVYAPQNTIFYELQYIFPLLEQEI